VTKRSQTPSEQNGDSNAGFDLNRPTGQLADIPTGDRPAPAVRPLGSEPAPPPVAKVGDGGAAWRGFEEYVPEIPSEPDHEYIDDAIDMTPMVDTVLLLLMFFLVTAAFIAHKSIEQPKVTTEDPSSTAVVTQVDEEDFIEIIIDQYNSYRLTSRSEMGVEAASDQEMRTQLRNMVEQHNTRKLVITAHGDAHHDKVVTAWDAGIDNRMESISIRTRDDDL
jgi:biopolymer transport protein ExbD